MNRKQAHHLNYPSQALDEITPFQLKFKTLWLFVTTVLLPSSLYYVDVVSDVLLALGYRTESLNLTLENLFYNSTCVTSTEPNGSFNFTCLPYTENISSPEEVQIMMDSEKNRLFSWFEWTLFLAVFTNIITITWYFVQLIQGKVMPWTKNLPLPRRLLCWVVFPLLAPVLMNFECFWAQKEYLYSSALRRLEVGNALLQKLFKQFYVFLN